MEYRCNKLIGGERHGQDFPWPEKVNSLKVPAVVGPGYEVYRRKSYGAPVSYTGGIMLHLFVIDGMSDIEAEAKLWELMLAGVGAVEVK